MALINAIPKQNQKTSYQFDKELNIMETKKFIRLWIDGNYTDTQADLLAVLLALYGYGYIDKNGNVSLFVDVQLFEYDYNNNDYIFARVIRNVEDAPPDTIQEYRRIIAMLE